MNENEYLEDAYCYSNIYAIMAYDHGTVPNLFGATYRFNARKHFHGPVLTLHIMQSSSVSFNILLLQILILSKTLFYLKLSVSAPDLLPSFC